MKFHSMVVLLAGLALSATAVAATPGAASCRSVASSYAQGVVSPEPLGDEDFFAKPPGPPNIMFLLGNSSSMQGFPVKIPDPGSLALPDGGIDAVGCFDNALGSGITTGVFNVATDGKTVYDPNYSNEFKTDPNKGLASFGDRLPWDGNGGNESNVAIQNDFSKGFYDKDINHICGDGSGNNSDIAKLLGYSSAQWLPYAALCNTCMSSQGWFRGPKMTSGPSSGQYTYGLSGRFLNKYPPKFAIARKVISDVFLAAGPVRLGIATLSTDPAYFDPAKYLFNGGGSRLAPACDKALSGTGFNSSRPQLQNALSKVQYNEGGHGIGEALFSIGGYYADQSTWASWFQTVPELAYPPGSGVVGTGIDDGESVHSPAGCDENGDCASTLLDYPNTTRGWSDGTNTWINGTSGAAQQVYESGGTAHMSMCFPCQVSTVIVISDSAPEADNTVPVTKFDAMVGKPVIAPGAAGAPGGVNTCINHCGGFGTPSCVATCDNGKGPKGPQVGNRNFMDDVAYFLAHQDLRPDPVAFPGSQVVNTYTVLFGTTPDPMMQGMAEAGGGLSYTSSNTAQLESAIFSAIADITTRSTSGASPALNNVQSSATQAAFIPRFHPVRQQAFWPGDLNAFFLYNEAITKCTPNGAGDLDNNGSCTGIYLLDANNKRIASDVAGQINANVPGLYYEVDSSDNLTTTRARPYWSASALLGARDPATRKVYTVVDSNGDGIFGGASLGATADAPVAFTPDNWATLLPYLGINKDPAFCPSFAAKSGISAIGTDLTFETCARMLIRYVLGYDVLNQESLPDDGTQPWTQKQRGNGNATWAAQGLEDQVLGDIFHSAPVRVSLPSDKRVCDLGTSDAQCVATLYASPVTVQKTAGVDAYQQWVNASLANKQADVILAGANDGMLHVFKANCWFDSFLDPTSLLGASSGLWPAPTLPAGYSGTPYKCASVTGAGAGALPGEELFAFISPDLLPKLKDLVGLRHTYFADGNAMVREIWVDGLQPDNSILNSAIDGTKQMGEYRTIAIMGERTGGNHYFALDLTDPLAYFEGRGTGSNPMLNTSGGSRFLWLYPDVSSPLDLTFGETWNDFSGRPPSIGPIRYKTASGVAYPGGFYSEKYVTIVGGGHDALGVRGRGVYMIDAWTGSTIKEFSPIADSTHYSAMTYPFGAAVGAFNWGDSSTRLTTGDNQYYWDTATVGDEGGQLWTFRFYDPDPSNWAGARALQEAKADGANEQHRFPIFNITTNVPTPQGFLRTNVGTGDKQHLRDQGVGACGFGNLRACITQACNVAVNEGYISGADTFSAAYSYNSGSRNSGETYAMVSPNTSLSPAPSPLLPTNADPCVATSGITPNIHINGGPCQDTQSSNPDGELVCSTDPSVMGPFFSSLLGAGQLIDSLIDGGAGSCYEQEGALTKVQSSYSTPALSSATYNLRNRFVSVRLFDKSGARAIFDTQAAATAYDTARLDDMVDLTLIPSTTFSFADGGNVPEEGAGWVLPYGVYDERGSANPTYVGGCLIWTTVEGGVFCDPAAPNPNSYCCDKYSDGGSINCGSTCQTDPAQPNYSECVGTSPCSRIGSSSQFTYTANMVNGNGGCGLAFNAAGSDGGSQPLRRLACTQNCDSLPPPAPAVISFIGQDGQVQTAVISAASRDVGVLQITAPDDLVKQIYDLPVSEQTHDCRHNGSCANTP